MSKIIIIKKAATFTQEANKELEQYYGDSVRAIGSYWDGSSVGTGLSFEEQDLLMPIILKVREDDRDFRQKVEDYFHDINTKVDSLSGLILEIGLRDDSEELSKTNMPLKIKDFVAYRHAIRHPKVAISESAAKGDQSILWFVVDSEKTSKEREEEAIKRRQALTQFLNIAENDKKLRQVYTNMYNEDASKLNPVDVYSKLEKSVNESPSKFLRIATDKNLEMEYKIRRAIFLKVLVRRGERIMVKESGDTIGNNMAESVDFFKDASKADRVALIMAAAQEASKNSKIEE